MVLSSEDRSKIDETKLYDYFFSWGQYEGKAAIALGFGSLYDHSFNPNADYKKDFDNQMIIFEAIKSINKGKEILVDYTQGGDEEDLWFDNYNSQ